MLQVEDLHKSFDKFKAVNGAYLAVEKGQLVAVIGPNANCEQTLLANYFWSKPTAMITPLTGLQTALEGKAEDPVTTE